MSFATYINNFKREGIKVLDGISESKYANLIKKANN